MRNSPILKTSKEDKTYGLTGVVPEEENQGKKIEQILRTIIEKTFLGGRKKTPETLLLKEHTTNLGIPSQNNKNILARLLHSKKKKIL